MKLFEFFEESNGTLSNVRLTSTLCIITGLYLTIWATIYGRPVDVSTLVVLLSAGFGGKVIQKSVEEKSTSEQK